ncbi:UNVERIFIED_ORG: cation transport protein ChaC [Rhizobium sp. SORGH_AS285]|nr:cation transport protein ChaC [Rhizobium sp. SORGH_AS_0285]
MDDFWVFGYGSLMWNPGFAFEERQQARLHGYRRSLCISSNFYRGTEEKPGLVLGLERGGSCLGVAFRVRGKDHDPVMAYLRERELVTNVYKERVVSIALSDGRRGSAVTYVADPAHEQYIGGLGVAESAVIIAAAARSLRSEHGLRLQHRAASAGHGHTRFLAGEHRCQCGRACRSASR